MGGMEVDNALVSFIQKLTAKGLSNKQVCDVLDVINETQIKLISKDAEKKTLKASPKTRRKRRSNRVRKFAPRNKKGATSAAIQTELRKAVSGLPLKELTARVNKILQIKVTESAVEQQVSKLLADDLVGYKYVSSASAWGGKERVFMLI